MGDLEAAQHVVEAPDPGHAALAGLVHGEVQGDAHEHLLRGLQRHVVVRADDVARQQQVEAGVGEQLVALRADHRLGAVELVGVVGIEHVVAVEPHAGEEGDLLAQAADAHLALALGEVTGGREGRHAGRDHLPAGGLRRGALGRCARQRGEPVALPARGEVEVSDRAEKHGGVVGGVGVVGPRAPQDGVQAVDAHEPADGIDGVGVRRRGSGPHGRW